MGTQNNNIAMSMKKNFINDSVKERTKCQTYRFGKTEQSNSLKKNCQLMGKVLNICKFNKVSLKISWLLCWYQKNWLLSKNIENIYIYLSIYLSIYINNISIFSAEQCLPFSSLRNNQQDAFLRLFILAQYKSI